PPPTILSLSLHDALPIYERDAAPVAAREDGIAGEEHTAPVGGVGPEGDGASWEVPTDLAQAQSRDRGRRAGPVRDDRIGPRDPLDRKSTRLNSSHVKISY